MADVWMKYCTRQAKCKWCEEPILKETPMVVVKILKYKEGIEKKYTTILRFHPQCWVDQAINSLGSEPPTRPEKLLLSKEDAKTRKRLLRNYATTKHRLKRMVGGGVYSIKMDRLVYKLQDIRSQIESVGGVPRKWPAIIETKSQ